MIARASVWNTRLNATAVALVSGVDAEGRHVDGVHHEEVAVHLVARRRPGPS